MRFFSILSMLTLLISCSKPSPNILVVGTVAGPESEVMEVVQTVAKKRFDLNIKIVEFNDYNLPNIALQDGSLDANVYQHLAYLNDAKRAHGYDFEVIGKTFIYPTAIYSKRYKSLTEIPDKATIAIPNDPSNEARALSLLQKAGLITLSTDKNLDLDNITSNPKKLKFKVLDAAQLSRVLPDVDAAVINTTFAIPAGLSPQSDGLFSESKDSPYANLVVIRKNSKKKVKLKQLVQALHSKEVQEKAASLFSDGAIPAW